MHSCRETKERLTELVVDGPDELSAAELNNCAECRAEFDALNATLRMTTRVSETAGPAEIYWSGYHARLREKLVMSEGISHAKAQRREVNAEKNRASALQSFFAPLRLCVRTAVPVPVPLVVLTILAFAALSVYVIRPAQPPANPSQVVVHVPVEVPMVQEKVVTRVVYRDRRSTSRTSRHAGIDAPAESTFAKSRKPEEIPASLNGFKPTDDVKLVVLKGGAPK